MIPKYLYHYTSIKSLKSIIEHRTIRFTRLDLLNDPYEGFCKINDVQNDLFKKLLYCSCWSYEGQEEIALWQIYTKSVGVRIKVDSRMFGNAFTITEHKSGYFPSQRISSININSALGYHKVNSVCGPIDVQYCMEENQLYQNGISKSIVNQGTEKEFEMNDIDLLEMGIRKLSHWAYEKECRFISSPFVEIHASNEVISQYFSLEMPEFIDIPLVMPIEEILVGPETSNEDYNKLERLVSNYENLKLSRSKIKTRFKKD